MSKVKDFMDTKLKARKRMRRYETRNKKLSRVRKVRHDVYPWFKGGYYAKGDFWTDIDQRIINGHGHLKRYNSSNTLKFCKARAARKFRRNFKVDEENYEIYRGSKYKKDYDISCELW